MFRSTFQGVALGLCLATAPFALAQNQPPQSATASPGTFSGRLTGAGMDGATITLMNTATGASQTATTDSTGAFSFSNLTPGSYRVMVRLRSGLQLGENSLEITPSGANQVQVVFTPSATAPGNLEIDGRAPTLETNSAEVSRSYDSQTIRSLPLLDRQHLELVTLMPGITPPFPAADRINDPQRLPTFNVNGQPAFANLYNQDGTYDNEPFYGRPLRVEPDEAVQALEVRTSNYNAEYGIAAGSWSSTLTRPGTNAIHGSLFEFNTNSFLRTGRSLESSQSPSRFNINQFGGTAGGPVLPDRAFWFLSYEGFIQRGRDEAVATVPAVGLSSGNFSQIPGAVIFNPLSGTPAGTGRTPFVGNVIPLSQLNSSSQQILALVPAANVAGFSNNLVGSVPLLDDDHRIDGKLDHRFSEKSTGFFRYGFTQASVNQGSLLGVVGSPLDSEFRGMNAVAGLTQVFTTNLLGEIRVGYDRYRNQIAPWNSNSAGILSAFPNGVPTINISGFTPLGFPANIPRKEIDNVYDGATNWNFHTGIQSLKFGIAIRSLQSNGFSNPFFGPLGSFIFGPGATLGSTASAANLNPAILQANALAGFLTGTPTQSGVSSFTTNPSYHQMQYGAYITDTINLFQHVYLELGVRYDVFRPLEPGQAGGAVLFDPATNTITPLGLNGGTRRSNRTDVDNVAPRIGLAFRPISRMVFRAGYGIHYFPVPFFLTDFNPVALGTQNGIAGGLGTTTFTVPVVPATGATAPNLPYFVSSTRGLETPYLQTYSGMIQGDLGNGFLMDIGYIGNVGRQLPFRAAQVGLPGTGLAGLPAGRTALIVQTGTGLTSSYNSLQVNLTKRFAAGLAFSGAYTYGKAIDHGIDLIDPFNIRNNRGPADWDRTHILSISHLWRLPFGPRSAYFKTGWAGRILGDWELNGILRWATGTPYTTTVDPVACACLGATSVPANFNGLGTFVNGSSTFNPALFTTPTPGTFGTLSRNDFRGPDFFVYNAAVFRNFSFRENMKIELRGEAYNLTNTTNLTNPVSNGTFPGFGNTVRTLDGLGGRQFQVAARILF
ncbi:MAG: Cna domain protein [Bryobacterales bacterium]|nr:Cna domain protein [Bryobacterales bacterium]